MRESEGEPDTLWTWVLCKARERGIRRNSLARTLDISVSRALATPELQ